MSDTYHSAEQHKPWDRIPGEPEKAFRAFECYLDMPYWERRDLHAYRAYVGNPEAPHVSATWLSWKEEFFWEERARLYDLYVQKERREQTIRAQVEAGYELGDELARMEQYLFHTHEMLYQKLRKELERDDREWRSLDLIHLARTVTEMYTAVQKARSLEKPDPYEEMQGFTEEELDRFFEKKAPNQRRAEKEAEAASPPAEDAEDYEGP